MLVSIPCEIKPTTWDREGIQERRNREEIDDKNQRGAAEFPGTSHENTIEISRATEAEEDHDQTT